MSGGTAVSRIVAAVMARDWNDLFILPEGAAGVGASEPEGEQRRGFFKRLRQNLSKTRQALGAEIQATLFETLDDETWERLEEALDRKGGV